ncbi:MAG: DUF4175 family protein, partial [Gemmatimonadaceae bacterium]
MSATLQLRRTQRTLRLAAASYAGGLAAVAIGGVHLLRALLLPTLSIGATWAMALLAGGAVWWFEFVRRGARHLTLEKSALWVEERVPAMQYALVSTLAPNALPLVAGLDRTIDRELWRRAEHASISRAMGRCAVLVLLGATAWWGSRLVPAGLLSRSGVDGARGRATGVGPALRVLATVIPPAYSGLPRQALTDPVTVRVLVGSKLTLDVSDSSATIRFAGGDQLASTTASADGRRLEVSVPSRSQALTIASARGSRVVVIDVLPDSAPTVTLIRPVRDSVLRTPTG